MQSNIGQADALVTRVTEVLLRPAYAVASAVVLLAAFGWVDYITGYELGFFVFYSVPVGLVAWYVGRWPAIGIAMAASVTWWLADYFSGAKYSSRFFYYWNGTIHFLAFVINAVTIAKIKSDLDRQHALAVELESMRRSLRSVDENSPVCHVCGAPRERRVPIEDATPTPTT